MTQDIHELAERYIDEVLKDQEALGYVGDAPAVTRDEAIAHAETVLGELAEATSSSEVIAA